MSEAVTRQRPSIDLDEFERRMRQSQTGGHEDDPLAELARLVGEQPDPYQDVFAQEAVAHPAAAYESEEYTGYEPSDHGYADRREPAFSPNLGGSFAAIEAGLRGGISPHDAVPADEQGHDHYQAYDEQPYAYAPEAVAYQTPAKSRRSLYLIGGLIAFGFVGVGGAFALKGHATNPSDVQTIMAASGPTKIQPPADAATDPGSSDSAGFGKAQVAPSKLLNNQEEPVDVAQTVAENAAKDGSPQPTDASSVPVPPSPGEAASGASQGAPSMTGADDFGLGMPAPKKVKVVSVRPDGTIVSDDQGAPAPLTNAAMPQDAAPAADAPALQMTAPAKSASRVLPKHTAATADGSDTTPAPRHRAKPAKPQKVAMADASDASTTDAAPAPKVSGGNFAVQLAAPGSEADAKAASSRFARKFASALEGRHLGFHKADSNGRSVYRVRVSSLSREEAVSLCEKLKSDGGTCFVARN